MHTSADVQILAHIGAPTQTHYAQGASETCALVHTDLVLVCTLLMFGSGASQRWEPIENPPALCEPEDALGAKKSKGKY